MKAINLVLLGIQWFNDQYSDTVVVGQNEPGTWTAVCSSNVAEYFLLRLTSLFNVSCVQHPVSAKQYFIVEQAETDKHTAS